LTAEAAESAENGMESGLGKRQERKSGRCVDNSWAVLFSAVSAFSAVKKEEEG